MARWLSIALVAMAGLAACNGPTVSAGGSETTASNTSTGSAPMTASNTATGTEGTTSGIATTGTTAAPTLSECGGDTGDGDAPPPPEGCEQTYLEDAEGNVDETKPSGLYYCPGEPWSTWYRSAAVTCLPNPGAECLRDCDCDPGYACLCEGGWSAWSGNRCIRSDCARHDDCAAGHLCKVSTLVACGGAIGFHCTTDVDECAIQADCRLGECRYDWVEEFWSCHDIVVCE